MSRGFDLPDFRLTPSVVSKRIGVSKVSNVVVEVFDDYHKWWERTSNRDLDSLMSMLFDLSLSHDIIGIQVYDLPKERYVYLTLEKCVGHSSNIDQKMMEVISRIEFDKGDRND